MGRVYHANYFVWLDMARTEFLRDHGASYKELEDQGLFFVVAETGFKYFGSAGFDDIVSIATKITECGAVSLRFEYTLTNKTTQKIIGTAFTKLGAVDKSGKIVKIPSLILEKLK